MRTITVFSNKKNPKMAAEELIEKAKVSLDFDPDLVLFYATLKYNGHYQEMLDIFQKRFGDIPQIGASVDGMIFPNEMRTDGAALVLCEDKDARIEVKSANENGAIRSAEELAKQIKCEKGVVILHFPLVHVPDALRSTEFYAMGKYYSFRANRGDEKTKKEMAGRFSDYCDKSKIFYLPPTVLEIFAKQLDYKVPVVGMNVLHTQVKFNSPSIFSNFKDIGDGIAALVIEKDDVEVVYDDIFPDKGATMEETMEIVKTNFNVVKEFNALFEKNVLISLDNEAPVTAVKNVTGAYEKNEKEIQEEFNKGSYQVSVPYFVSFFNKKTGGFLSIGIDAYFPFDLFPFFADVSEFSNLVFLGHEPIFIKMNDYISALFLLNNTKNFNLFCLDVGSISAFGNKTLDFKIEIEKQLHENYF
ncbi:MAG: FIST N-terminal domain-containing protein, partial [ANME-2 cluster archaeon]|nr:FIST N-terminal domain-containing protein [ANME-2 cluster archaeon]